MTKRDDELKAAAEAWLTDPTAQPLPAVALYRRAGLPDVLIAMTQDGRAWEVPDAAGGWEARRELGKAPGARGLTRLDQTAEDRALTRLAVTMPGPAEDLQPTEATPAAAEPTPKPKRGGSSSGKGKGKATAEPTAPAPARGGPRKAAAGLTSQVVCYVTAAELAALVERAAKDDRSVSYIARAAIRAYLELG